MRVVVWLSVVGLLSGCAALIPSPEARDVSGATDGYTPTASFLKVFVKNESGLSTLVNFDRRDWYVAKIAEMLDQRELRFLDVRGQERHIPGEVIVASVRLPEDLTKLRYTAMSVSPQEQWRLDQEYDALLASVPTPPSTNLPALPDVS